MNWKKFLKRGILGAAAVTLLIGGGVPAEAAPQVRVTGGVIQGYDSDGLQIFKGIPYADTTAGANRWREPQPVKAWRGVKDCTEFSPIAVQNEASTLDYQMPWTDEYLDLGMNLENGLMGEDCLSVNVWTPAASANDKLPVIVYIHGGANVSGSGANDVYDGTEIAKKGVVYVSMNYRVGIFGFLAYKDRTGEEVTGNFAVQDQIAALEWVQENISKFGGDPDNVTIMGQSAGSINVQNLIASTAAAGLFKKAIALSMNSVTTDFPSRSTLAEAEAASQKAIGNYTLKQLRAMSPAEILALQYMPNTVIVNSSKTGTRFLPDAFATGEWNKVDMIWGGVEGDQFLFDAVIPNGNFLEPASNITADEYTESARKSFGSASAEFLKLYAPKKNSVTVARQANVDRMMSNYFYAAGLKNDADSNYKTYLFYFDHVIPDTPERMKKYGAFHSSDVNYWLNHYTKIYPRSFTAKDYALGEAMSSYLVNFAKTGDPNGKDSRGKNLPRWYAFDGSDRISYLHIGDKIRQTEMNASKSKFWLSVF